MPQVIVSYLDENRIPIRMNIFSTPRDTAYILEDINKVINPDGEWSNVPKDTRTITIEIPCEF